MTQLFANNAAATLNGAINSSVTTINLTAGHGARFPAITGSDYFYLTLIGLDGSGVENAWEIVKVTARSTDALTVVRGQDGTAAASWASGTRIELRDTAATLTGMLALIAALTPKAWATKTGSYTAAVGDRLRVDTAAGVANVACPPGAVDGDKFITLDYSATFQTNKLTVTANTGQTVRGQASLDVTTKGSCIEWLYDSTKGWIPT